MTYVGFANRRSSVTGFQLSTTASVDKSSDQGVANRKICHERD